MHTARILVTTALLTLAGASFAHGTAPQAQVPYDYVEWRQDVRIQRGLADGSLTRAASYRGPYRQGKETSSPRPATAA